MPECVFSPCRRYRYRWRAQSMPGADLTDRTALWVMLNPSTADEAGPDPTVRRCMGYSERWGYGWAEVVNLFALRSTNPRALYAAEDPIGPENDHHILEAAANADLVVCGWGNHGRHLGRGKWVLRRLRHVCRPHFLRITKSGEPGHPLYLPGALTPAPWFPHEEVS